MVHFPKSFLGAFPLYIGVEIALGITIFNKCSGFYGILGLITGHDLDLMQWLLYVVSIIAVIVYSLALTQVYKPQLLMYSLTVVVFTIDTALTCFFTLWFSGQWFSAKHHEMTDPSSQTHQSGSPESKYARGENLASQSASQTAEFFFTMLVTLLALSWRFYFNFIILAFVQRLFRHPKYMVDLNDVEQDLKNKSQLAKCWYKSECICYKWCKHYLA
ncbi:LADA_0B03378g1_1 [Lachancea dasiensis]|uniref:LADA_0B03378g1_1 n=1 Tax=Lachancea dasiensis TaxID=1072105 RepID=A0A1G4ISE9_9SACH|nr:LADA_0B03378g1_1 [Lachancea dasiensis]